MRRGLPNDVDHEKDPYSLYEGVEYEEFWFGYQKRNLDDLEHTMVRRLLPKSGQRIVDVGCGFGRLADCYLDRFQQVIMVDGSMSLLRKARDRTNGQAVYIASDVRQLPFQRASFDAALLIRVFHHVDDSQTCLSEMHRVTGNDSRFIFNYCNKRNVEKVMQWLLRTRVSNPFTREPDSVGSTFISHHPKAVHELMHEIGFNDMKYYGLGVMDRLIGRFGQSVWNLSFAEKLAPFFAWSKIAPWILCQATTRSNARLIEYEQIIDILQCPSCGGELSEVIQGYNCLICNIHFPLEDGIIGFRISNPSKEKKDRNG